MGKYSSYRHEAYEPKKATESHPIWRGIGFILIILVPLLSYGVATIFLEQNKVTKWIAIPREVILKGSDPELLARLIVAAVISFVIFVIFQFIGFLLYGMFGPKRYSPLDAPPIRRKTRRSR